MTDNEKLSCLIDRPCAACKFHKAEGCSKWSCVFEERSDVPKGKTYGEKINFYLKSLVETYKRMGYIITEISITDKNSLSPTIYEFEEEESDE